VSLFGEASWWPARRQIPMASAVERASLDEL
jgi:hypothetical protein